MKINIIDVIKNEVYYGDLTFSNNLVECKKIGEEQRNVPYALPGFVDSHVHIESSMLSPVGFAELAVRQGTVAAVCDPHEIANVLGVEGVEYMIGLSKKARMKLFFGVPSCVPATSFESSGAEIKSEDVANLLKRNEIVALSEMMNFPGVLNNDKEVVSKLLSAKENKKPIDGHAPGLHGDALKKYVQAGISTDHECVSIDEALEKIELGMHIQIREGSAAKNFEILHSLLSKHHSKVMFCTDDCHPDDLIVGHINKLVSRAINKGYDLFDVLQAAILNPIQHYKLDVGLLQNGDNADFIIVDNLKEFNVINTFINGTKVYDKEKPVNSFGDYPVLNQFNAEPLVEDALKVQYLGGKLKVIEAFDGDLYTDVLTIYPKTDKGFVVSDTDNDVLKMVVLDRYSNEKVNPSVGFIKNIGLKSGAIAGSIAHDSHNIIAVGVNDEQITKAVNIIIQSKGGIVAVDGNKIEHLPLEIAGLMTAEKGEIVADTYAKISKMAKEMGSKLTAPFMTLSFMALLVIPKLKLSDRALFDVENFKEVSIFTEQ